MSCYQFLAIVFLPKMVLKNFKPCYCYHLCSACSVGENESRNAANTGKLAQLQTSLLWRSIFSFLPRPSWSLKLSWPSENRRCHLNTSALLAEIFPLCHLNHFQCICVYVFRDHDKTMIARISSRSNGDIFL